MAELPIPSWDQDDDTARLEDLLTTAIGRVRALVEADVERVRKRKPGAAVGYTVDRTYARTLGESAIRYYSGS